MSVGYAVPERCNEHRSARLTGHGGSPIFAVSYTTNYVSMTRRTDKRERLVAAAKLLIHKQGFNHTTLAAIAEEAGVPLGNVYYYFRTKEDLAAAVIEERTTEFERLFAAWEREQHDPRARLLAYTDLVGELRDTLATAGCPVGGLCEELDKLQSELLGKANRILRLHLEWVTEQFRQLGKGEQAGDLALHFLAGVQGMSLLAHAFGDPGIVDREVRSLRGWVQSI